MAAKLRQIARFTPVYGAKREFLRNWPGKFLLKSARMCLHYARNKARPNEMDASIAL
jgi:hypothetical protein